MPTFTLNCTVAPGNGNFTLEIVPSVPTNPVAPCPCFFGVTLTGDNGLPSILTDAPVGAVDTMWDDDYHRVYIDWDFGEPSSGTFSAPDRLPAAMRQKNEGHGHYVGHLFETPGVAPLVTATAYTAEFTGGNLVITILDTDTYQMPTIQDPDVYFAGTKTVYIDPTGTWAGADPGWETQLTYTDYLDVPGRGDWDSLNERRVLFAAGQNHVIPPRWGQFRPVGNHYFMSFGTGRATLKPTSGASDLWFVYDVTDNGSNTSQATVWHNLNFEAEDFWDEVAAETIGAVNPNPSAMALGGVGRFCLSSCDFQGFDTNLRPQGAYNAANVSVGNALLCWNTTMSNWRQYGLLGGNGSARFVLRGCKWARSQNAFSNMLNVNIANQGAIRMAYNGPDIVYMQSELMNRASRDALAQSAIRAWVGSMIDDVSLSAEPRIMMWHMLCEGGEAMVAMGNASGRTAYPTNSIIRDSILIANWGSQRFLSIARSCYQVDNVAMFYPDIPGRIDPNNRATNLPTSKDISASVPALSGGDNDKHPILLRNVTLYDYSDGSTGEAPILTASDLTASGYVGQNIVEGYYVHAPNYLSNPTDLGPFATAATITTDMLGPIMLAGDGVTKEEWTEFASPANSHNLLAPSVGSALRQSLANAAPRKDMLGTTRPTDGTATAGPIEAA